MRPPEPSVTPRTIALRPVIIGSLVLPIRHFDDVFRQLAVPLLAVIGLALLTFAVQTQGQPIAHWTCYAAYLLATSWLALTTHRMVLLDSTGSPLSFDWPSIRRLGLFALVAGGIAIVFTVTRLALDTLILNLLFSRYVPAGEVRTDPPNMEAIIAWVDFAVYSAVFFFLGRLFLLLPAIAVDRKFDLAANWRASRGNTWRMAVVVGVLPWVLMWLLGLVWSGGIIGWAVIQVLIALTLVIEVVAVSLAYQQLTTDTAAPAPPPKDPHD